MASRSTLDVTLWANTDCAKFFLYHPDDLAHRSSSPAGWPSYNFACRKEFQAGRLVAFDTGGDGGFSFRITSGRLTPRERKWLIGSWDFRLAVRHGQVFLDGGYCVPGGEFRSDPNDYKRQWIKVDNGNYRVTVNVIEFYSEPGVVDEEGNVSKEALACYVICMKRVQSLANIRVSSMPPLLDPCRKGKPHLCKSTTEYQTFTEEKKTPLENHYVVFVEEKAPLVPGFHIRKQVSYAFFRAASFGTRAVPRIEQAVLASSRTTPCLGVLTRPGSGGKEGRQPYWQFFTAERFVKVTRIRKVGRWEMATVEPVKRPASKVASAKLTALKKAFVIYIKNDAEFRKSVTYPDFKAERVMAIRSAEGLTHYLIHHLHMPTADRIKLLTLSDAKRVDRLGKLLDEANRHAQGAGVNHI